MDISAMFNEIIDLALSKEDEAIDLFSEMASGSRDPATKALFKKLIKMEKGHKAKLEKLDKVRLESHPITPQDNIKITDYLSDYLSTHELKPNSSYTEILLYAIKKEESAVALYSDLATIYATVPEVKRLFEFLAQEEALHKKELELEYAKLVPIPQ